MASLVVASRSFSKHPVLRNMVLDSYPDAVFNDDGLSLKGGSLIDFLKGHEKAITALEKIDEYVLSQLPDLKVIGKYGVGLDMIDLNAMHKHDVNWDGLAVLIRGLCLSWLFPQQLPCCIELYLPVQKSVKVNGTK